MVDDLNMGQRFGSSPDQVGSSSQQVAGGTKFLRVSESGGEVSSTQKVSKFFRVEFVVFDFAAVDGFEVKCVTKDEWDFPFATSVGQPVPVESRLTADDDVSSERFDVVKEFVRLSGFEVSVELFFASLIDDTGVHLVGVQVDSAVEWVLSLIQIHRFSLSGFST